MRVNVVQLAKGSAIVVVMSKDEAQPLLGIARFLAGGYDDNAVDAMQKLENLLESGIEEIEQVIEVEQASDN